MSYDVHPSAIVDPGATIGAGSKVWHFAHVCAGAKIGKNVSLGQNVFVANRVIIGDSCKIQNNVSVYDNVTLEDGSSAARPWCSRTSTIPAPGLSVRTSTATRSSAQGNPGRQLHDRLRRNDRPLCVRRSGSGRQEGRSRLCARRGHTARQIGWMSAYGERLDLPMDGDADFVCPHTKDVYALRAGRVSRTEVPA